MQLNLSNLVYDCVGVSKHQSILSGLINSRKSTCVMTINCQLGNGSSPTGLNHVLPAVIFISPRHCLEFRELTYCAKHNEVRRISIFHPRARQLGSVSESLVSQSLFAATKIRVTPTFTVCTIVSAFPFDWALYVTTVFGFFSASINACLQAEASNAGPVSVINTSGQQNCSNIL